MSPDQSPVVRREPIPGGRAWSVILRRGFALRLTDIEGGANCSALFFNADAPLERYNLADTLKAQHTAYLTRGHVCYSDMGRILVSITEDTLGWHDALCGVSTEAEVLAQFGAQRYQEARNAFQRSGETLFLIELGKWGLGVRDLVANVNFFSKVTVDEAGSLHYQPGHSRVGSSVTLRAEMNTLVILNTAPHPLDPATSWQPRSINCAITVAEASVDDQCRLSRPENARGFANTARYHSQCDHPHVKP